MAWDHAAPRRAGGALRDASPVKARPGRAPSPRRSGSNATRIHGMRDASRIAAIAASERHIRDPCPAPRRRTDQRMRQVTLKGGRLELLVPHVVRGQLFRPSICLFIAMKVCESQYLQARYSF